MLPESCHINITLITGDSVSGTGWKPNMYFFLKSQYHNSRFIIKAPRHLLQALPWTENCCGPFSRPSRPELLHLRLGLAVPESGGQERRCCPLRDVKQHPGLHLLDAKQQALPQSPDTAQCLWRAALLYTRSIIPRTGCLCPGSRHPTSVLHTTGSCWIREPRRKWIEVS